MLHHITEDGYLHWHCDNPVCAHHNCAGWHEERQCPHHANNDAQGTTFIAHISHPGIIHPALPDGTLNTGLVQLPACECGTQMTLNIGLSAQELAEPTIERAPDGSITSVTVNGASNLTLIDVEEVQQDVEDPTTAALRKALAAHGIEVPIVMRRSMVGRIRGVRRPYWLEHHLRLAELMVTKGRT